MSDTFDAKTASRLSGFGSLMMLNYVERQGIFERDEVRLNVIAASRRSGRRRQYSFRDVVILRSVHQLLDRGVSVARIKTAMMRLARDPKFECERGSLSYDRKPVQFFVTDGTEIFFPSAADTLTSLTNAGQQAFTFVMNVQQASQEVSLAHPARKRSA